MKPCYAYFVRPALAAICVGSLATLAACGGNSCIGLNGCGENGGPIGVPSVTLSGTAADGGALASATVNFSCAQGSGSALSDGGGHYAITFNATLPCVITVNAGGTNLHSLAFSGGTFNTTPTTDLMLVYLASQLGTNETSLLANFPSNAQIQQVLANQTDVLAAQSAVVTNLQQRYALKLTAPAFLTTPFIVGQAGVDADLDALAKAGAIDANGMPDQAAVSLLTTAGLAHPLSATSTSASSTGTGAGTGSTSGTSGTSGTTGGMM